LKKEKNKFYQFRELLKLKNKLCIQKSKYKKQ
jgi:hypothetical protein